MTPEEKVVILARAHKWFGEKIVASHLNMTRAVIDKPENLQVNPFTVRYLAKFISGHVTPESLAQAVLYPRVLGTSIGTIFGTHAQSFISEVLDGFGSTTSGIDIEFTDQVDGARKYCQVKAGPNTINKDDVTTVHNHFAAAKRLAITNNLRVGLNDFVIGILYGETEDINASYKALRDGHHYTVYVGKDFWHKLTGEADFYYELIRACSSAADAIDTAGILEEGIQKLARTEIFQKLAE